MNTYEREVIEGSFLIGGYYRVVVRNPHSTTSWERTIEVRDWSNGVVMIVRRRIKDGRTQQAHRLLDRIVERAKRKFMQKGRLTRKMSTN